MCRLQFLECYKKVGDLVDASPCAVVFESYQKCLDGDSRSPHGLCKAFKDEASSCAAKHFGKGL